MLWQLRCLNNKVLIFVLSVSEVLYDTRPHLVEILISLYVLFMGSNYLCTSGWLDIIASWLQLWENSQLVILNLFLLYQYFFRPGEWPRVVEKDWGADFRKLSAGAALVALTLWLDHMQVSAQNNIILIWSCINLINRKRHQCSKTCLRISWTIVKFCSSAFVLILLLCYRYHELWPVRARQLDTLRSLLVWKIHYICMCLFYAPMEGFWIFPFVVVILPINWE